mmetsp:Transcript_11413/g.21074  ORF Transcript_11413/g.21074 Transcript_11413/m.21074 type:complete len:86 (-) Transcript_11413:1583-1840(-)
MEGSDSDDGRPDGLGEEGMGRSDSDDRDDDDGEDEESQSSYATFSSDEEDVNHGHVNFEENFLDYETGDTHAMADIARSDPYIKK